MKRKTMGWIAVAVAVASAFLLMACASTPTQKTGETAATLDTTEGTWKHVTQFNGYSIDMQCHGTTGIYVLRSHYGMAVLGNDPLCK